MIFGTWKIMETQKRTHYSMEKVDPSTETVMMFTIRCLCWCDVNFNVEVKCWVRVVKTGEALTCSWQEAMILIYKTTAWKSRSINGNFNDVHYKMLIWCQFWCWGEMVGESGEDWGFNLFLTGSHDLWTESAAAFFHLKHCLLDIAIIAAMYSYTLPLKYLQKRNIV